MTVPGSVAGGGEWFNAGVPAIAAAAALSAAALAILAWRGSAWGSRRHEQRLLRLTRIELAELFVFVEPRRFIRINVMALLLLPALVGAASGSLLAAAVAFGSVLVLPAWLYRRLRRRRTHLLQRQLPEAMSAIAAGLRGGAGLWQALELVPRHQPQPVSQEFALVLRQHRMGLPLDDALQEFAARSGLHDVRMLVATLAIARDLGGGLAEVLERLSQAVRRRVSMEERIDALTSQGRMQGRIVGALPLLLGAVLYALEPGPMSRLFVTPIGWLVLGLVLALELVGALLIRRIVRIDV